ncbi:hypothetical protein [Anaeromicrobium sediminis]|nr:hypothetical protein [Anaeromicrobium sediminis]
MTMMACPNFDADFYHTEEKKEEKNSHFNEIKLIREQNLLD